MALTRPFINTVPAFDATIGTTLTINVLKGDSITDYQFSIFSDENTDTPIFISNKYSVLNDIDDGSIRTFSVDIVNNMVGIESTLNLQNNKQYRIQPKTYNGETSQIGNFTLFICYKKPSIELNYSSIVNNSLAYKILKDNVTFETINPAIKIYFFPHDINSIAQPNIANIKLYGVTDSGLEELIYTSPKLYNFSHDTVTNTYSLDTEINGLSINIDKDGNLLSSAVRKYKNFSLYYNISTIENFVLEGTIKNLNCYYNTLRNSPYININNLCDEGIIRINCSLTSFSGTSNPSPANYLSEGTEIDLTKTDTWAQWQKHFILEDSYTLRIWGRNFNSGVIVSMTSTIYSDKYIKISYNEKEDEVFVSLLCGQGNLNGEPMFPYYIESNKISKNEVTANTTLCIGVQQKNALFDISLSIIE